MICSLSKHEAEKDGYDDALMLDYRDYIAEATGANIFFVKNKKFSPLKLIVFSMVLLDKP